MADHERCDDVTCPTCSGLPEPEPARPVFRLAPAGRKEDVGKDGALYRVHTFYVIDEDEQVITDTTVDGEQPILIQSVPMRITRPTRPVPPRGILLN